MRDDIISFFELQSCVAMEGLGGYEFERYLQGEIGYRQTGDCRAGAYRLAHSVDPDQGPAPRLHELSRQAGDFLIEEIGRLRCTEDWSGETRPYAV
jgi:hypothetical protein